MAQLYDARGNTYCVATPGDVGRFVSIPSDATQAVSARKKWVRSAIEEFCVSKEQNVKGGQAKKYRSDGLLVGPFLCQGGIDLIIVNTDGTLAERSGNGATIFSQFLLEVGLIGSSPFSIRVQHGNATAPPTDILVKPSVWNNRQGFWIDMGTPAFGASTVEASEKFLKASQLNGIDVSRVAALENLSALWTRSQFVNIGNPHCVTFLDDPTSLPEMEELSSINMGSRLTDIANNSEEGALPGRGNPCRKGINLQWAVVTGADSIEARVFERGEGPTKSSGSSATAIASAARHLGMVTEDVVRVIMPGGIAPIYLDGTKRAVSKAMLFGEATRLSTSA